MKKLDLHIHTVQTVSDHPFSFSIEKLKEYVQKLKIEGIAITNHNMFNLKHRVFIEAFTFVNKSVSVF